MKINFLKKIKMTNNKKNVFKISLGTIMGQGVSIFTLPIITRLYGPNIIGVWALINSISVIINSISDLGLLNSLMIESEDNVEKSYKVITTLSVLIALVGSAIITILYFFIFEETINKFVLFLLIFVISAMLQQIQICYTWLNRKGEYNILMKNPIIHNGISGVLAITLGFAGFNMYGYYVAQIIGKAITILNMKRHLPLSMFTVKISDFKDILVQNKRFVYFQLPTNIIGRIKGELPTLLIRTFWGVDILGFFSISLKLLHMPSNLLAAAIGRVFFQRTSELKRQNKSIGNFVDNTLKRAMKLGLLPLVLLVAFGDVVTIIFLGEEWRIAGNFLRILGLQYYFVFIMNSVQGLAITLEKQKFAMVSIISQVIAYIIAFSTGKFLFNNIYTSLVIMSVLVILIKIIYYSILYNVMDMSWKNYVKSTILSVVIILVTSSVLRFLILDSGFLYRVMSNLGIPINL